MQEASLNYITEITTEQVINIESDITNVMFSRTP